MLARPPVCSTSCSSEFLLDSKLSWDRRKKFKNNALVRNIGHFDKEIDFACSEGSEGLKVYIIKPRSIFLFPLV